MGASIDDLLATTMEPLQDVDTALLARLDRQFQVSIEGTLTDVSAIVDLPENPGKRTPPYILITPWSVQAVGERGGSGEIIDNYTTTGAFVRPAPQEIQLEYRIDVFAQVRSHKTLVMEHILGQLPCAPAPGGEWRASGDDAIRTVARAASVPRSPGPYAAFLSCECRDGGRGASVPTLGCSYTFHSSPGWQRDSGSADSVMLQVVGDGRTRAIAGGGIHGF